LKKEGCISNYLTLFNGGDVLFMLFFGSFAENSRDAFL
jgi:hypothetical protein